MRTARMKLGGTIPNVPKAILLGAPHTSNWDLIVALGMRHELGLNYSWMMKKEAFIFPFAGMFKRLGGIPVDRHAAKDVIGQISDWFNANEKAWIGITPEGTRAKVSSFKTGYLRIAYATGVPVFVVGVNSETRTLVFDQFVDLTGDIQVDNANIRAFVRSKYTGLNPDKG